MNCGLRHLLIASMFAFPIFSQAESENYWHCASHDALSGQWLVNHSYQRVAINRALELCKQQSKDPGSCEVSKEACDYYVDGINRSPAWQCTALDFNAQPWNSNPYKKMDDAALAAQAFCKANSSLPETCYINTISCINLSEQ